MFARGWALHTAVLTAASGGIRADVCVKRQYCDIQVWRNGGVNVQALQLNVMLAHQRAAQPS